MPYVIFGSIVYREQNFHEFEINLHFIIVSDTSLTLQFQEGHTTTGMTDIKSTALNIIVMQSLKCSHLQKIAMFVDLDCNRVTA